LKNYLLLCSFYAFFEYSSQYYSRRYSLRTPFSSFLLNCSLHFCLFISISLRSLLKLEIFYSTLLLVRKIAWMTYFCKFSSLNWNTYNLPQTHHLLIELSEKLRVLKKCSGKCDQRINTLLHFYFLSSIARIAPSGAQRYVRVTLRTGRLKIEAKDDLFISCLSVSLILGSERDLRN